MLSIIIGVGLAALLIFIALNLIKKESNAVCTFMIGICMGIAGIGIGLFAPLKGDKEPKLLETIELVSLSNSTESFTKGNILYVSTNAENVYSYREKIDSPYNTEDSNSYELKTVSEHVIEVEDKNCTKPELRIYNRKAKMSIWSFALCNSYKEYVFYVPKGTISHQAKLE